MTVLEDLFYELTNITALTSIIGSNVFFKNPTGDLEDNYIVYSRKPKTRNMVSQFNIFQVVAFSKDMKVLDQIANELILHFENKREMNGNSYYSIFLYAQVDGEKKLQSGHYYSILTFEFRETT